MRALLTKPGKQQWNAQGGTAGASMARSFSDPAVLLDGVMPGMSSKFVLHEVSACNDDQYGQNAAMRVDEAGASLLVPSRKRLTCFAAGAGRIFVEEAMLSHRRFAEVYTSAAKGFIKAGCTLWMHRGVHSRQVVARVNVMPELDFYDLAEKDISDSHFTTNCVMKRCRK